MFKACKLRKGRSYRKATLPFVQMIFVKLSCTLWGQFYWHYFWDYFFTNCNNNNTFLDWATFTNSRVFALKNSNISWLICTRILCFKKSTQPFSCLWNREPLKLFYKLIINESGDSLHHSLHENFKIEGILISKYIAATHFYLRKKIGRAKNSRLVFLHASAMTS